MRKLRLSDAAKLAQIHASSFADRWSASEFEKMLSDESFFGFCCSSGDLKEGRDRGADEIVGFILCRRACETIDIVTFCVDPKFRLIGIGRKLLKAMIKFAEENACEIFLEVSEKNLGAVSLYQSVGFKKISVRKDYYKTKEGLQNAWLMLWKLEER